MRLARDSIPEKISMPSPTVEHVTEGVAAASLDLPAGTQEKQGKDGEARMNGGIPARKGPKNESEKSGTVGSESALASSAVGGGLSSSSTPARGKGDHAKGREESIANNTAGAAAMTCNNSGKGSSSSSAPLSQPFVFPELPPNLASMRRVGQDGSTQPKSAQEILADLNSSPLFMTELEENDDLAAIQALAYEGTPLENASDFKERGNEAFREKRWVDSREFYSRGIAILREVAKSREKAQKGTEVEAKGKEKEEGRDKVEAKAENPEATPSEPPSEEELVKEGAVLEQLYANRAASQLSLKNYRLCVADCGAVLRLNPRNSKALFRSAKALLAVGRLAEADDACARGLELEPSSGPLRSLGAEIVAAHDKMTKAQRAADDKAAAEKRRRRLLAAALAARNIRTRRSTKAAGDRPLPQVEMGLEDARIRLVPDPYDPASELSFPALLLYPLRLQTDIVSSFGERETLGQHLEYILPPPWDDDAAGGGGEYGPKMVECYMETATPGGLVKVGRNMPLLQILGAAKVEVVDELLRFFVVPKKRAAEWIADFKAKRAAERGA